MSEALNITTAAFGGLREVTTAPLWQYDYGQILQITGLDLPQAVEVHFSNSRKSGETVTQIGTDSQVVIPDMFLTSGADIYCFIFLHDGLTDGETEYVIKIPVRERPEPSDVEPTPVQQSVIDQAIAALNTAVTQTAADVISADASAQAAAQSATGAQTAATQAQGSATSASASASTASTAAATATTKASEAAQSASEAESAKASARNYAASASDSAGDADEAKTAAQGAAQTATTKASEASTSATSASGSASAASASASQASESATSAANSATAASGSATAAAGSASTASTKASEASASATAAQAAQTAAEAAQTAAETAAATFGTDTTLTVAGRAADAKATGDEIGNLKSDLSDVENRLITIGGTEELVSSELTNINFSINTASKWARISTSKTIAGVYDLSGINEIIITPQDGVTNVWAFLKTVNPVLGETPDFADNYQTRITANNSAPRRYEVTADMQYLYVLVVNSSSIDAYPSRIELVQYLKTDSTLTEAFLPANAKAVGDQLALSTRYIRTLTNEDDLNNLRGNGVYFRGASATPVNGPDTTFSYMLIVYAGENAVRQIVVGTNNMWFRVVSETTSLQWRMMASAASTLSALGEIANGDDIDTFVDNVYYAFTSTTNIINSPIAGEAGNLIVINPRKTQESSTNTATVLQIMVSASGGFYIRRNSTTGWLPWHKLRGEEDAPLFQSVDLSQLGTVSFGITSNGKYTNLSNASKGVLIEVPSGAKKISFIGKNAGYIAILNSWNPVVGEAADFNAMYTRRIMMHADGVMEYRIDSNVKYIFALLTNIAGVDLSPTDFRFYFDSTPESLQELPVLYLNGDTAGMSKDNAVMLNYWFMGISGTASVKWQGSSSQRYVKKNYTIKFDNGMDGWALWANYVNTLRESNGNISRIDTTSRWGTQTKFCTKANWIDPSAARNIVCARLWGQIVKSRVTAGTVTDNRKDAPNYGAIDGFPIEIRINNETVGLYTFNIPKDGWLFNMGEGTAEYVVAGEDNSKNACKWKEAALVDGTDYSVEYAPDGVAEATVAASLNTAITTAINAGADWETALAPYLDVDSVFDYFIFTCCINNHDALARNILYGTYDGVKWFMSAYDLDTTFGVDPYATSWFDVVNDRNQFAEAAQMHRLAELMYTYSKTKLKTRYQQLRSSILSDANVWKELSNFIVDIPTRDYNIDRNRWPSMPGTATANMAQYMEYYRMHCKYLDDETDAL